MSKFAIYFPQFYPVDVNDAAWGSGFTDWTLVAAANARDIWPRRAPRRGYYDGSSASVHRQQVDEARTSGIDGFAVYHYWFYHSHQLSAFERTLLGECPPEPAFPWFVIWATESWSRRWIGDATQILALNSDPAPTEVALHCDYLVQSFYSSGYFSINGRPLFVIYNLGHFAHPEKLLDTYRVAFAERGVDPFIGHFVKNPADIGFAGLVDFNYLFEPRLYFGTRRLARGRTAGVALNSMRRMFGGAANERLMVLVDKIQQRGCIYSSEEFVEYMGSAARRRISDSVGGLVQNVISPGWNNAPRYGNNFTCLKSLPPTEFARLVRTSDISILPVLINAWNEWSEGAAVEPCAYLEGRYLDSLA